MDDSVSEMPTDSLVKLKAHTPVWSKILHYLPMDAKKNLRVSQPRVFRDILNGDPAWIWTIHLGSNQMEYPEFFFDATIPVKVNFPKDGYGDLMENPANCDQMLQTIDKINNRIIGLAVHVGTLHRYRDQLKIDSLQIIEVGGKIEEDEFYALCSLITEQRNLRKLMLVNHANSDCTIHVGMTQQLVNMLYLDHSDILLGEKFVNMYDTKFCNFCKFWPNISDEAKQRPCGPEFIFDVFDGTWM